MWQGFCRCARSARSITVRTRRLPTLRAGTVGFERAPRLTSVRSTPQRVGSPPISRGERLTQGAARQGRHPGPEGCRADRFGWSAVRCASGLAFGQHATSILGRDGVRAPKRAQRNAIPFRGQVTTLFAGNPMRASRSDILGSGRLPGEALHLRAIPALLSNA